MFTNAKLFLKNDFHMKEGMRRLIELFYSSILNDTQPPIPYKEILLTTRIMDQAFAQMKRNGR